MAQWRHGDALRMCESRIVSKLMIFFLLYITLYNLTLIPFPSFHIYTRAIATPPCLHSSTRATLQINGLAAYAPAPQHAALPLHLTYKRPAPRW
jgi:hypothetical protein